MNPSKSLSLDAFSRQMVEIMPLMFRDMAKREANELTRGTISFPQMVALDHVERNDRTTMTELAHILSIKTSSATVLVDRLIRQKMLSRQRDESDRRLVWVRITPKGRKVVGEIMEEKRRTMKGMFAVLSAKERKHYLAMLLKVKDSLLKNTQGDKAR
jgi:DNA-binding MarR family transcriptional regulator